MGNIKRDTDQWNRDARNKDSHIWSPDLQGTKAFSERKKSLYNIWCWETEFPHAKVGPLPYTYKNLLEIHQKPKCKT